MDREWVTYGVMARGTDMQSEQVMVEGTLFATVRVEEMQCDQVPG